MVIVDETHQSCGVAAEIAAREAEIVAATRRLFDGNGVREANIDEIATATVRPDKVVGFHFFYPASRAKIRYRC